MNFRVVNKEIFPISDINAVIKKFRTGDCVTLHIRKVNGKYWEARYLKPVEGNK